MGLREESGCPGFAVLVLSTASLTRVRRLHGLELNHDEIISAGGKMREKSGILMKWAFWRDFRHTGAAQLIGPADSEPNVVMASQLSCWESCSPATCSCWRSRGWEWPPLASPPDPRKQKNPAEGTGTVHFVGKGPCFQSSGRVVRGKRVWELGTSEVS